MSRRTKAEIVASIRELLRRPDLELTVPVVIGFGATVLSWRTEGFGPMASGRFVVVDVGGAFFAALGGIESSGPYDSPEVATDGRVWLSDGVRHTIDFNGALSDFAGAFVFDEVAEWDARLSVNGRELSMAEFKRAVDEASQTEVDVSGRSDRSSNAARPTDLRSAVLRALAERGHEMTVRELSMLEGELEYLMEE